MNVTEKAASGHPLDENTKKLVSVAKGLEETLLSYANYKPLKKNQLNIDGKDRKESEQEKVTKFRNLIDKIFEFK